MIEYTQVISDKDYRKAIAIHYFGYKFTYILPVMGFLIIFGLLIYLILMPEGYPSPPILLYLLGAYMIFRPLYYIQNVFKSFKTSNLFSNETDITITNDKKIIISNGGNLSSINLSDLYTYANTKNFIFLYVARNQYVIFDKRQMDDSSIAELLFMLTSLNIKKR